MVDKVSKKHTVKVVTPIYSSTLSDLEKSALQNNMRMLADYPHVLVKPVGLDLSEITKELPPHEIMEVSDEWLGKKNGIAGYNRMMLSKAFYERFLDSEYILICHLDAWIFRDELSTWCDKGFDCVAPSWIRREVYDWPIINIYFGLKKRLTHKDGKITKEDIYNKIGNGGLSLRRIDSFVQACDQYQERIEKFLTKRHHLSNEDVFWAVVPVEFRYPTLEEALEFGFDTNPKYCLNKKGGKLPFGCHSWTKPRYYKFWKQYIKA